MVGPNIYSILARMKRYRIAILDKDMLNTKESTSSTKLVRKRVGGSGLHLGDCSNS